MPLHNHPPKGYLPPEMAFEHDCSARFSLSAYSETKNSTMVPLVFQDPNIEVASTTFVNPKHASFEQSANSACLNDSSVPQLQLSFNCSLSKLAIETDALRNLKLNYMFINTAFLSRLDANDSGTSQDIENILELNHATASEEVHPLYSGVDLPVNYAMPAAQLGLTTDTKIESIAFVKDTFFEAMKWFENKSMLRTVAPTMRTVTLKKDYPYQRSGILPMKPIVKYMNPYTFCALLFHVEIAGSAQQIPNLADITDLALGHVNINMKWRFREWNKEFYQEMA